MYAMVQMEKYSGWTCFSYDRYSLQRRGCDNEISAINDNVFVHRNIYFLIGSHSLTCFRRYIKICEEDTE